MNDVTVSVRSIGEGGEPTKKSRLAEVSASPDLRILIIRTDLRDVTF